MASYLVSGASRGIGLGLVSRLAKENPSNIIFAGARNPQTSDALQALANEHGDQIKIVQLDPTSQASVDAAIKTLEEQQGSLDVIINNAGAMNGGYAGILDMDLQALQSNFDINVVGVARLTNAAIPLLRKAGTRKIVIISSNAGTMDFTTACPYGSIVAAYGPTKIGANMLGAHYAVALKEEGFVVQLIHPGHVRTDMGGVTGALSVEESVDGVVKVIASGKKGDPVALVSWDAKTLPW